MRIGNFWGLPVSIAFFSFIALFVTAGTVVLFSHSTSACPAASLCAPGAPAWRWC